MTVAVLDIKQWGNNLGVRLPAAVARAAHLSVDQRVQCLWKAGKWSSRRLTMRRSPLSSGWRFSILRGMAAKPWPASAANMLAPSGGSKKACRSGKALSLGAGSPGHHLDRL